MRTGSRLRHALSAARPNLLRIVGPGSLGVVSPALRAHLGAPSCTVKAGGVAWVSQSNALTNAVLGWAHARGLGFSHAVALGDEADVDAGDVLDYLASDPGTRAILLELDTVRAARKFMSAARAAARNKPVLALRSGRARSRRWRSTPPRSAARAWCASMRSTICSTKSKRSASGRVAAGASATLITSDRGLATLACDAFAAAGDTLAPWPAEASDALQQALPHAVGGNPLQLGDDARPEHFGTALKLLAEHRSTGTAFVVHASTHGAPVGEVAQALIANQRFAYRGLLACFFGGVDAATRDALHAQGIPVHTTPQRLARAFARLVDYRMGRELLMQTPEGLPAQIPEAIDARSGAGVRRRWRRWRCTKLDWRSGGAVSRSSFGLRALKRREVNAGSIRNTRSSISPSSFTTTTTSARVPLHRAFGRWHSEAAARLRPAAAQPDARARHGHALALRAAWPRRSRRWPR